MGVLDLSREPPRATAVAGGSPFFYFAWAPDGRRVLAHSGLDRLEQVDLAGRTTAVSRRPGLFATPAWSTDGRTVVYAERGGDGTQRLVAVVDGEAPRLLVQGKGAISFVLRPDGGAVAYQLLGRDDDDLYDRRATQPGDGVRVVDVRTGVTRRATSIRALTFWWSPDGERLLALAPEPEAPGAIPFLWQVWSGGRASEVAGRHSPTIEVLRDYAPFFTQYALSTTPWAPDASAFAYASEGPGGAGQIVVQEVGGDPVAIAPGVFVTWSPS
jgi:Tol biopolymer transport system component